MSIDNTVISEFIEHLKDGDWHSIYSIHERYRLDPVKIIDAINFLSELRLIDVDEMKIRLVASKDFSSIQEIRKILLGYRIGFTENDLDKRYAQPLLQVNELYLPKRHLLDKSLLASSFFVENELP